MRIEDRPRIGVLRARRLRLRGRRRAPRAPSSFPLRPWPLPAPRRETRRRRTRCRPAAMSGRRARRTISRESRGERATTSSARAGSSGEMIRAQSSPVAATLAAEEVAAQSLERRARRLRAHLSSCVICRRKRRDSTARPSMRPVLRRAGERLAILARGVRVFSSRRRDLSARARISSTPFSAPRGLPASASSRIFSTWRTDAPPIHFRATDSRCAGRATKKEGHASTGNFVRNGAFPVFRCQSRARRTVRRAARAPCP